MLSEPGALFFDKELMTFSIVPGVVKNFEFKGVFLIFCMLMATSGRGGPWMELN